MHNFFILQSFYAGMFRKCQQHDCIFISVNFPSHSLLLLVITTCYLLSLTVQSISISIGCPKMGLANDKNIATVQYTVLVFTKYYKLGMENIDIAIMTDSQ